MKIKNGSMQQHVAKSTKKETHRGRTTTWNAMTCKQVKGCSRCIWPNAIFETLKFILGVRHTLATYSIRTRRRPAHAPLDWCCSANPNERSSGLDARVHSPSSDDTKCHPITQTLPISRDSHELQQQQQCNCPNLKLYFPNDKKTTCVTECTASHQTQHANQ